ncbi:MAG TPA: NIPSNAP family protein, partial [Chryseosolibacter sp.]
MSQLFEIRSYNLKPGTREEFHRLFLEEAFAMLQRWNVDVVAYGPSLHDQDSYFLMRRYDSLARREESEDAFYGSDEWKQGPRELIIALIENYTEIVLELEQATIDGLRRIQHEHKTDRRSAGRFCVRGSAVRLEDSSLALRSVSL